MKKLITTLILVTANSQLLLGMKKRGFGANRWNGFGGKVNAGESVEAAAMREIKEECGIAPRSLEKRGLFYFHFENGQDDIEMHLFQASDFEGEIVETEEMRPQWFYYDEIPYDKMWADDRFWIPYFLEGKDITANFVFKDNDHLLDYKITETKDFKIKA